MGCLLPRDPGASARCVIRPPRGDFGDRGPTRRVLERSLPARDEAEDAREGVAPNNRLDRRAVLIDDSTGSTISKAVRAAAQVRSRCSLMRALLTGRLRAAGDHDVPDGDPDRLVVLVERRRSHLEHTPIGTRPRRPHLDDLGLDAQGISGPHGPQPTDLVEAGPHDAARRSDEPRATRIACPE